jgi:hypothetical protein
LVSGILRPRSSTALFLSPHEEQKNKKTKNKTRKTKPKEKIFFGKNDSETLRTLFLFAESIVHFVKLMPWCAVSLFTPSNRHLFQHSQPTRAIMSSFMMKQENAMLTLERDSLNESLNEIESTLTANQSKSERSKAQKIRDRLSQINKRLKQISSVLEAEESAAAAKAEAERAAAEAAARKKAEAEAERRARLPPDTFIDCRDCEEEFVFSGEDQDRFSQNGWNPPIRCAECRQARKEQREQGGGSEDRAERAPKFSAITICCKDCKGGFEFSAAMQKKFAKMDFAAPVRCDDCRQKKKDSAPKAVLINCRECHSDFSFSVGAQKHFAEMKWNAPTRCGGCRKLAATKKDTRSTKRSA